MSESTGRNFPTGVSEGHVHTMIPSMDSYKFIGGDISDVNNWRKIITVDESGRIPANDESEIADGLLIVDITYSALLALYNAGSLVKGQQYRIIDFRTKLLIPNTTDYSEGAIEPIIVMAMSATQLSPVALSTLYPTDVLNYEIVCTHKDESGAALVGPDRGWIYYRHDVMQNNKLTYDFRVCKWRRWEHPTITGPGGSPLYLLYTDPGGGAGYQDYLTFVDYTIVRDNDFSEQLDKSGGADNQGNYNNVFFGQVAHCNCKSQFYGNTFNCDINRTEFGIAFNRNLIAGYDPGTGYTKSSFSYNWFQDNFSRNTIKDGQLFYGMCFYIDVFNNTFNGYFKDCDWKHTTTFGSSSITGKTFQIDAASGIVNFNLEDADFGNLAAASLLIAGQRYYITDSLEARIAISTSTYYVENAEVGSGIGVTNTFTTVDGKTVTVTNGIITSIV